VPPPTPTDLPSPKGGEEGGAADEPIAESEPPAEAEPGAGVPSRRPTSVVLETLAPESVGIGQKFVYEITVRNLGKEPVFQVRVEDEVPEGATFLGGDPAPEASGNQLRWDLGALEAGGEKRIRVELRPTAEGEVRTRPTVTVSASAAVRARVTRPVLTAAVTGPARAEVGGEVVFRMQLTNSGTGPAERVRLHAELSPGLRHPHGQVVEAEVPELLPGASKTVELKTTAAAPGEQTCSLLVSAEGSPPAKGRAAVEVRQQRLRLALSGPGRGLVNAEPTFTLELTNPGAAPSGPVRLRAVLPEGLEFVSASDGGTYDRALRTVRWELPPQPPGPPRELSVRARAAAAGTWRVRAAAEADPVQGAAAEHAIEVEGIPALRFEVVDLEDVIEVGKETTYEIRIVNQGTGPCTNLKLAGLLSEGLAVTAVNSPVAHRTDGRHLLFDPYPRLSAKADLVLRVRVRGERPGDHRFRVQLSCDQISNPVVKEEATRFYRP
ncbi:MAG TPA: hypothetical protein VIL46_16610, partial [Gemmataceae bacterium]